MMKWKTIILGMVFVVIAAAIGAGVFIYKKRLAQTATSTKKTELVDITAEGSKSEKILLFTIKTDSASQAMQVQSIDQYNGFADTPDNQEKNYSFSVVQDGNPVYLTYFDIPVTVVEDFSQKGKIKTDGLIKAQTLSFKTPRFSDGAKLTIKDKTGKVLLTSTLKDVAVHNNTTEFKTLSADPSK